MIYLPTTSWAQSAPVLFACGMIAWRLVSQPNIQKEERNICVYLSPVWAVLCWLSRFYGWDGPRRKISIGLSLYCRRYLLYVVHLVIKPVHLANLSCTGPWIPDDLQLHAECRLPLLGIHVQRDIYRVKMLIKMD